MGVNKKRMLLTLSGFDVTKGIQRDIRQIGVSPDPCPLSSFVSRPNSATDYSSTATTTPTQPKPVISAPAIRTYLNPLSRSQLLARDSSTPHYFNQFHLISSDISSLSLLSVPSRLDLSHLIFFELG